MFAKVSDKGFPVYKVQLIYQRDITCIVYLPSSQELYYPRVRVSHHPRHLYMVYCDRCKPFEMLMDFTTYINILLNISLAGGQSLK